MRHRQGNLDGTRHKAGDPGTSPARKGKKAGDAKEQISHKKSISVKGKSGAQAVVAAKPPAKKTKKGKEEQKTFFGIDLHKEFLQVAAVDQDGTLLMNKRITNDFETIAKEFAAFPKDAKYVLESSSVWYGVYKKLAVDMGLDVVLSNPYLTRMIAVSKKKTDKFDAHTLADMLRGGFIHTCYISPPDTVEEKQTVRFRTRMVQTRTRMKNMIHGILLQEAIKIPGQPFSPAFVGALHRLDNWRIEEYLKSIDSLNERIHTADIRVNSMVRDNEYAQILMSIPGVGRFTALIVASEIDDIKRFPDPDKLVGYMGLAPSVRNSAGIVHHGRITRAGNKMVRWILVEAVLSHRIHAKEETALTEFYKRIARKRGSSKAIVATAAKMLRIMYWMLKKQIDFAECQRLRNMSRKKATARHLGNVKTPKKRRKIARKQATHD